VLTAKGVTVIAALGPNLLLAGLVSATKNVFTEGPPFKASGTFTIS
jgi:hypothetical protein